MGAAFWLLCGAISGTNCSFTSPLVFCDPFCAVLVMIVGALLLYRQWAQRRAQQRMQEELSNILCDYMPLSGMYLLLPGLDIFLFSYEGLEMDEMNSKKQAAALREALV